MLNMKTLGAVHTHTHTHTQVVLNNIFSNIDKIKNKDPCYGLRLLYLRI